MGHGAIYLWGIQSPSGPTAGNGRDNEQTQTHLTLYVNLSFMQTQLLTEDKEQRVQQMKQCVQCHEHEMLLS